MNEHFIEPNPADSRVRFAANGGEMSNRTREFDWTRTPVGPIREWPQSLKIAVQIMLDSRYAMWLGWGPEFIFFYNDAYAKMTLGPKHPWALGRPTREVWPEIWPDIGPRAEKVISTGQATWDEGLLLFLQRQGFPEETYHTFSYSPIPDDEGGIGGMLCVVTEDTERTIGERRLRTLRELAARTTVGSKSAEDACVTAVMTLTINSHDLPFVLIYLNDDDRRIARLVGATKSLESSAAAPVSIDLKAEDGTHGWPLRSVYTKGQAEVVDDLESRFGTLPGGPWPESPNRAVVLPIRQPGQSRAAGFLIAGVSPRLAFSDDYRGFLELLAGHVSTAVSNARAYAEERRRSEALAEIDRAKTAFFSNVSHEFRTPLTLMLGPVQDLLSRSQTDLPPTAAGQLEVVNRNGLRLLRLVNSLLDFSRIEAGRVRAIYQPTDLAYFTADLASNFRSACERAGLKLIVDCPALAEPAYVDVEMWEKIVLNLISNAFKFTLEGEIAVSLRRNGDVIELRVRDTGTGIPAEEMPRLFERFHRIENARGRTHEGSGIGLALVQELAKLHGGSVQAESVVAEGTSFVVRIPNGSAHLPADQVNESRPTATGVGPAPFFEEALRWLPTETDNRATHSEQTSSQNEDTVRTRTWDSSKADQRPLVLVADDNTDMRQYVARLLSQQFQVESVPDGEAALAAIWERSPDLVLTDVMMPKLNGFGLLKQLRAHPRTRDLPVIMLSARAGEESRVEGMEAGADDYLVKPFGARELLARVTAHLQMSRMRREAIQAIRESEERFRALVSATSDGVYRMSPDWTEMRFLDGQDFHAETAQPIESWLDKYIFPEDKPQVLAVINEAIRTKGVFELEHRVRRADGTAGWTFSRAVPLLNSEGQIVEWFGAASDVTARKEAQEKLRQSEERLRVTLASIGDAVITTNTEARITFLNGVAEALTGWATFDALDQPLDVVFNIVDEATGAPVQNPAMRALREGVIVGLANHTVLIRKDGTQRPIDDSAAPVRDSDGQVVGCVLVFRDVSERRQREQQAIEEAQASRKLAAIVDSSEDAIISKALDGTIQSWNEAAERIFGYKADEVIGRPITILFPPDRLGEEEGIISQIRSGARLQHFDTIRLRQDGAAVPVSLALSPIRDERGRIIGVSKIARDITDRKRLEDELRQVAAELSHANRQKDEFLATLAHELRNPLAPIRNGLQLIRLSGSQNGPIDEVRTMMERQMTHLVRLVDDLMDLSRITRGKIDLRKERIELATVLNSAVEISRPMIEEMSHELVITLSSRPIILDADPTRLAQVFMNLLTNAAKYSERGGHIELSAERQGNEVVVSVKDTGIGIPVDMLDRIFDMFSQVDRSLEKAQGGLGIGLTLVKRLVIMHEGTVHVKSEGHGHGAEFIVRLPIAMDAPLPERGQDKLPQSKFNFRVLIVDDNRDGANSLAMMLRVMGNETATAYDGQQGMTVAEQLKPDVVLLDIGLPKLNGYELARWIRQQPWGQRTILIAVTGWGQDDDRRRSQEAGFDYHMIKPVDSNALLKVLGELQESR